MKVLTVVLFFSPRPPITVQLCAHARARRAHTHARARAHTQTHHRLDKHRAYPGTHPARTLRHAPPSANSALQPQPWRNKPEGPPGDECRRTCRGGACVATSTKQLARRWFSFHEGQGARSGALHTSAQHLPRAGGKGYTERARASACVFAFQCMCSRVRRVCGGGMWDRTLCAGYISWGFVDFHLSVNQFQVRAKPNYCFYGRFEGIRF